MARQNNNYENATHFSYSDYKKKTNKKENKDLVIFLSVFVISLLVILGFAKILSPNVDLGIANIEQETSYDEDESITNVDNRLNNIKDEDDGVVKSDSDMFSPELDEKVILPVTKSKPISVQEDTKKVQEKIEETTSAKKEDTKAPVAKSNPATSSKPVTAKVVVGYYSTEQQANVAKSIMHDAGVSYTPIVKNLGGYYSLQMGVYSSKEKAQQVVNDLLKNNFPARMLVE